MVENLNYIQIPVHFQTEDFNHELVYSPDHSDEFLLPSARFIFSSQEDELDPGFNDDLDDIFHQPAPRLGLIPTEEIEHSLRIPVELGPHSDLSTTSVQDVFPERINEGLRSIFDPHMEINPDSMRILPFSQDLSQFAVVLELLDIQARDLEKRLLYRRAIKETIEKRKAEMDKWKSGINEEIHVTRHEEGQLYEQLAGKIEALRAHCRARMQEFRNGPAGCRAILENFPQKYNLKLNRLIRRAQDIERAILIQEKNVEEEEAMLKKKYEERKEKPGKKKCLYYYEASFMRELKKKFELEKDLRDVFLEFIREVKPTEGEETVLKIEPMMREIYIRGNTLMAMMHWVEVKENVGPLKMNEKMGFVTGNPEPMRIALTIDRFLVIYRMDMASREFSFEEQMKVGELTLRRDGQNLNRMIVKEEKAGFFWNKEREFSVDLGSQVDVGEFIQDFNERYY